ncbi:hypothetical protein [Streptomyces sp. A0592]|uniref:hypothetical protein n=1 Tax=Streptomyces sp. A0592 TaxID=2563099 RepID=UPI00109ED4F4|nr:hypothetical protein [Streptomyces sp. A0592]THA77827.1 hypothetical protein E6U81_34245 [Streptomyces sp. A0592]
MVLDDGLEVPMGRPGILKKPQIDAGPLKVLIESLHDLHLQVGRPSLSKISTKSGKKTDDGYLGTSTISYVMSEPRLPDSHTMQRLVAVLVEFAPAGSMNLDETTVRFIERWKAAAKAEADPPPSPRVQDLLKTGHAYLRLAEQYQRAERMAGRVLSERTVANEWAYVAELSAPLLGDEHPVTVGARERASANTG